MAHSDNNWVIRIEVFCVKFVLVRYNLRATLIAITLLHFLQFVLHYLLTKLRIVKN